MPCDCVCVGCGQCLVTVCVVVSWSVPCDCVCVCVVVSWSVPCDCVCVCCGQLISAL